MRTKKFRAKNMSDGLALIKREMGNDAVILSTARVIDKKEGRLLEISVTSGEPDSALVNRAKQEPSPDGQDSLRSLVRDLMQQIQSLRSDVRQMHVDRELKTNRTETPTETRPHGPAPTSTADNGALGQAVRLMAVDNRVFTRSISFLFQTLRASGLRETDIESLIGDAVRACTEPADNPKRLVRHLKARIAEVVNTTMPISDQRSTKPQLNVLIGPTGVGKTTTLAKIAGQAKYGSGRKVGLICADTFRIGGVYQLETYADLMEIPMLVADSLGGMRSALVELSDCDLVLVDTTGHNPWSSVDKQAVPFEAYHNISDDYVTRIHVCLSAATRIDDSIAMLRRYAGIRPASLLFTKLDEAQGVGSLISAAMATGTPISQVCSGTKVPDDIYCPTSHEIAGWALNPKLSKLCGKMRSVTKARRRTAQTPEREGGVSPGNVSGRDQAAPQEQPEAA